VERELKEALVMFHLSNWLGDPNATGNDWIVGGSGITITTKNVKPATKCSWRNEILNLNPLSEVE
jgi:hypothetical protein